jgi:hypothetical protein
MEQFLSQIPQSVIEKYNITATQYFLTIQSDKDNYINISNKEIVIRESANTITFREKNYVVSLYKEIKLCNITLLDNFPN